MLTPVIVILSFIIAFISYLYHKWTFWKRQGIPTDYSSRNGQLFHFADQKCHQKYGRIVGYYEGLRPCLSITDPEWIRKVLVSEFHKFVNHRDLTLVNEPFHNGLFFQRYPHWKRVRAILAPFFTTGSLKAMIPIIEDSSKKLIAKLREHSLKDSIVDLRLIYDSFTFDVISKAAIGVNTDSVNKPLNNPLFEAVKGLFQFDSGIRTTVAFHWPILRNLFKCSFFSVENQKLITDTIKHVTHERIAKNVEVSDLLQMTIDASVMSTKENKNKSFERLTEQELLAQNMQLVAGGHETTATQLCFLTQELALNPNYQNRLVDEIKSTFNDYKDINYEKLMKMEFLDAFIKETMRMKNAANRADRVAANDITIDGIFIPKNTPIIIPIWAIHMDPEFYDKPHEFRPERWLPENEYLIRDYTYLPFATGPRNCIGQRFALLEMKYTLVKLLMNFEFEACDQTKNVEFFNPMIQVAAVKNMIVGVKPRNL